MVTEELRIGNKVQLLDAEIVTVSCIDMFGEVKIKDGRGNYFYFPISVLRPIPINSSWLTELLGFEVATDNEHITSYMDSRGFYICQSKEDDDFIRTAGHWYTGESWDNIKYIHELQNYYYWIGNFKKEIGSKPDGK